MSAYEDKQVRLAIAGDPEALSALLEQFALQAASAIASEIDAKWRSVLDVDDVMQTSFLEAFLRIGQCKATSTLR